MKLKIRMLKDALLSADGCRVRSLRAGDLLEADEASAVAWIQRGLAEQVTAADEGRKLKEPVRGAKAERDPRMKKPEGKPRGTRKRAKG